MAPSALALCFPANVKCTRQFEETAGASVCWISQRTGFRNLQFPRCGRETPPSVSDPWPGHVNLTEAKGGEKFLVPDICTVSRGKVLAVVSEEPAQNGFQWASVGTC